MSNAPICVIVDRNIRPGSNLAFEYLLEGIIRASSQFNGYLDSHVNKPKNRDENRYQVLFRFDNQENLDKWIYSDVRREWVEKIDRLIENPTKLQVITGLESWFALPGQKNMTPPPRYKMAAVTWLAITPLLIVFNLIFGPLLNELPFVLRFVVSTPFIVMIMTYAWMPLVTKLFKSWLYPKQL